MTEKFNLATELAKNFGLDLEEAYDTMLAFPLKINLIVTHHKTAES